MSKEGMNELIYQKKNSSGAVGFQRSLGWEWGWAGDQGRLSGGGDELGGPWYFQGRVGSDNCSSQVTSPPSVEGRRLELEALITP